MFPLIHVLLVCLLLGLPGVGSARAASVTSPPEDFSRWLESFAVEARGRGISDGTLEASLTGLQPLPRVIELDRSQPKAPSQFCTYLDRRLSETRIARGRRMLREHGPLLERISAEYGVPPRFVVALWGLETNFGDYLGTYPVIAALATLAHEGRREELFRTQLHAALQIVDEGHSSPADLKGSWAGATGQVQLMPTTFLDYAVDYDGDGIKDVWSNLEDAFATAASYLRRSGWRSGETWGRQVRVPDALSVDRPGLADRRQLSEWRRAGVKREDGRSLPDADIRGSLVFPTRSAQPAFLVYDNYRSVLRWNNSTFFAVSVGTLADELSGARTLRACRFR